MSKTIYKLDSKQKLRFLTIYTEGSEVVQISGLMDTGSPLENRSQCVAKNIGKANQTSPEEQAIVEAQAKLTKKLGEGYYETPEEAEAGDLILPMLAKDYKKEFKKVKYPAFVQPKLDGMRCLKGVNTMISRKNKPITTMKHISKKLQSYATLFDGELYAEGETFQRNMELIKKYRPGESEQVKFHVYDMVLPDKSFFERNRLLGLIIGRENPENIVLVPTYYVESESQMLEYHKQFLAEGYEGTIIRWGSEGYAVNKRSSNLLKYKDFQDLACTIVDVEPSEKRPDQGVFICALKDGRTFGCGMKFSHAERAEMLQNKSDYIGKVGEVRFFEYTDDQLPRFPVCVGIRLDIK